MRASPAIESSDSPRLRCNAHSRRSFGVASFSARYNCSNSTSLMRGRYSSPFANCQDKRTTLHRLYARHYINVHTSKRFTITYGFKSSNAGGFFSWKMRKAIVKSVAKRLAATIFIFTKGFVTNVFLKHFFQNQTMERRKKK